MDREPNITIRPEQSDDYKLVEEMIRKAFYNLYVPGCNEHYLAHVMRSHEDFLPELDLVLEVDGQIAGNIMYTKAKLLDENGEERTILTFGPVCISPEHQRKGLGKRLMEASFELANSLGYDIIVIFGNPGNYVSSGFVSCIRHNISLENGAFPSAMLVKELRPHILDGRKWVYHESSALRIDEQAAEQFDSALEPMEKKVQPSQEEFFIHSHATITV
jgi:putative acetyltransferase